MIFFLLIDELVEGLYFHCSLSMCELVCLSVRISVRLPGSACEQNSSRTDALIWTQFSLYKWMLTTLARTLLKFQTWVKVQGLSDSICMFFSSYLLSSLPHISDLLCLIKLKFSMPLRYVLCRSVVEFDKNQMCDDVMLTSFKFSPYKFPYFKFY